MDARLTTARGTWRGPIAAGVALTLVIALGASSASAASPTACRVRNTATGETFTSLQAAIDAANQGDRLTIQGTCYGRTVIDRKLFLKGVSTAESGRPILDGDGKGPVLRIKPAATVTIRSLVVQGGVIRTRNSSTGQFIHGRGAGILNRGTLRLWATIVRDNWAWDGGGIYSTGMLRLRGASRVSRNSAAPSSFCLKCNGRGAGGLYNTGIATLSDASGVRANDGAGVVNHGRLILNDMSSIERNMWGVTNYGSLTLNDSTTIRDNRGFEGSQGVNSDGGDVTMNDASSIADHQGGYYTWGLNMYGGGTLTMSGSSVIRDNRAENDLFGGGLGAGPDVTMVGVTCGPRGNVYDNYPHDCTFRSASS